MSDNNKRKALLNKYSVPEMREIILRYGKEGKTIRQLANDLNCGRKTIYTWKEKFPQIDDALELHHEFFTAYYETLIQAFIRNEMSFTKEQVSCMQQMLYTYDQTWKESKNTRVEKKEEDPLTKMDDSELDEEIARLIKELKS